MKTVNVDNMLYFNANSLLLEIIFSSNPILLQIIIVLQMCFNFRQGVYSHCCPIDNCYTFNCIVLIAKNVSNVVLDHIKIDLHMSNLLFFKLLQN